MESSDNAADSFRKPQSPCRSSLCVARREWAPTHDVMTSTHTHTRTLVRLWYMLVYGPSRLIVYVYSITPRVARYTGTVTDIELSVPTQDQNVPIHESQNGERLCEANYSEKYGRPASEYFCNKLKMFFRTWPS